MDERRHDEEPPPAPEPSMPEEPQTSLHFQAIQPEVEPAEANERTVEEESLRREHGGDEGDPAERSPGS